MAATLTDAQLEELKTFDSATIANAIEQFKVRDQTLGYVGSNVRALFPNKREPMVGYAVTAKATAPPTHGDVTPPFNSSSGKPWTRRRDRPSSSSRTPATTHPSPATAAT